MGDRLAAWVSDVAGRVFGPVFALEASRVGRRLSTFVARWVYLGILAGVLALFFYSWSSDFSRRGVVDPATLTRFAENFFWVYSVTQFLAVCALTPAFTAGAITDEKERKTLDFLLVTDLSGREIVFGKLAARVGVLLTFVLAGLPILSIMQFVGGIDPDMVLLASGMTLATVLSLAGVGVAASVLLNRTRDAVVVAYALPVAYLWLTPYNPSLDAGSPRLLRLAIDAYTAGNPFVTVRIMGRTFGGGGVPDAAAWYIGFHLVVAVIGFCAAGLLLRRSASKTGVVGARPRGRAGRMVAWVLGRRTKARRHPPIGNRPMVWREVHVEPGSGGGLLYRLLALGVLAAVVWPLLAILGNFVWRSNDPLSRGYYARTPWDGVRREIQVWVCAATCGLGILMMLRATVRGASAVAGERDRDTWASLLATPLATREILWGKWAGCVLGQRDLMCLLGAVWAVGVLTLSVNPFSLAFAAVALAVYVTAFAWLGLSYSASARSSREAIAKAVPVAIFAGGGYWIVLGCCCAGIGIGGGGSGEVLAHVGGFMAGFTPPFVLAGLPAVDSELLKDMAKPDRGYSAFVLAVAGGVFGVVGWGVLGHVWSIHARAQFAGEANRDEEETPGTTTPKRPRPPAAPLDDWDTEEPT